MPDNALDPTALREAVRRATDRVTELYLHPEEEWRRKAIAMDLRALASGVEALLEENARIKTERGELRQRVEQAEKAARATVESCQRQGVSLGRGLANYAYQMCQREVTALRAEVARLRADAERVDWLEREGGRLSGPANDSPRFVIWGDTDDADVQGETVREAIDKARDLTAYRKTQAMSGRATKAFVDAARSRGTEGGTDG